MALEAIVGTRIASECSFRLAGVLVDPTTVVCRLRSPNRVLTTITYPAPDLVREDEGLYRCEFTAAVSGPWAVRWEGSGGVEAVGEQTVMVYPSSVI
jgi:hypothetical protein